MIRLRPLFKESYETLIKVLLMLVCNDFPELPNAKSTARRFLVQWFDAEWTSDDSKIDPENYIFKKMGPNALRRKMERLRFAMIGQLMRIGSEFMTPKETQFEEEDAEDIAEIPVPPTLVNERNAVLARFDLWSRFKNDTVSPLSQGE